MRFITNKQKQSVQWSTISHSTCFYYIFCLSFIATWLQLLFWKLVFLWININNIGDNKKKNKNRDTSEVKSRLLNAKIHRCADSVQRGWPGQWFLQEWTSSFEQSSAELLSLPWQQWWIKQEAWEGKVIEVSANMWVTKSMCYFPVHSTWLEQFFRLLFNFQSRLSACFKHMFFHVLCSFILQRNYQGYILHEKRYLINWIHALRYDFVISIFSCWAINP